MHCKLCSHRMVSSVLGPMLLLQSLERLKGWFLFLPSCWQARAERLVASGVQEGAQLLVDGRGVKVGV